MANAGDVRKGERSRYFSTFFDHLEVSPFRAGRRSVGVLYLDTPHRRSRERACASFGDSALDGVGSGWRLIGCRRSGKVYQMTYFSGYLLEFFITQRLSTSVDNL